MYRLFIANKNYSTWSLRPWLLLTQLQIPFEEVLIPFGSSEWHNNPSPTGQVPCLADLQADDETTVIWDSLAITEYVADDYPEVWPQDKKARAWARSASAEMHSGFHNLRAICTNNIGLRIDIREKMTPALLKDIKRIEQLWGEGLTSFGGPFLAGQNFSAVDAFFAPVVFRFQTYGIELNDTAARYADHLQGLPAMQDWYQSSLAETWRDEPHEADARHAGHWIEDLRAI